MGSEMCIRDRLGTSGGGRPITEGKPIPRGRPSPDPERETRSPASTSPAAGEPEAGTVVESLPLATLARGINRSPRSPPATMIGTAGGGRPIPGARPIPGGRTISLGLVSRLGIVPPPGIGVPPPEVPVTMGGGDRGEGLIPPANSTRGRDSAIVPASGSSAASDVYKRQTCYHGWRRSWRGLDPPG